MMINDTGVNFWDAESLLQAVELVTELSANIVLRLQKTS